MGKTCLKEQKTGQAFLPPSLGNLFVIVQQLVGLALEVAVVKDIHQGVLIGLAQNPVLVGLVQALGTAAL